MIEKQVTLYICEYCKKEYKSKHYCNKHENLCYKNPKNNSICFNCNHFVQNTLNEKITNRKRKVFFCAFKQIALCPKQFTPYQFKDYENEFLKDTCNHFDNSYEIPF